MNSRWVKHQHAKHHTFTCKKLSKWFHDNARVRVRQPRCDSYEWSFGLFFIQCNSFNIWKIKHCFKQPSGFVWVIIKKTEPNRIQHYTITMNLWNSNYENYNNIQGTWMPFSISKIFKFVEPTFFIAMERMFLTSYPEKEFELTGHNTHAAST